MSYQSDQGTFKGPPIIQFDSLWGAETKRQELARKIAALGGTFLNKDEFQGNTTHVVCDVIKLSLKFLCACVKGLWVVSTKYIQDSYDAGRWLNEKVYEHSLEDPKQESELVSAYKRWHWRVNMFKKPAFHGWKVALSVETSKIAAFERLLTSGGAQLIPLALPPLEDITVPDDAFVIMDSIHKHLAAGIMGYGLLCLNEGFIIDTIMKDEELDHFNYLVFNPTLKKVDLHLTPNNNLDASDSQSQHDGPCASNNQVDAADNEPNSNGCGSQNSQIDVCKNEPNSNRYGSQNSQIDVCKNEPNSDRYGSQNSQIDVCKNEPNSDRYGSQNSQIDVCKNEPNSNGCGSQNSQIDVCKNEPNSCEFDDGEIEINVPNSGHKKDKKEMEDSDGSLVMTPNREMDFPSNMLASNSIGNSEMENSDQESNDVTSASSVSNRIYRSLYVSLQNGHPSSREIPVSSKHKKNKRKDVTVKATLPHNNSHQSVVVHLSICSDDGSVNRSKKHLSTGQNVKSFESREESSPLDTPINRISSQVKGLDTNVPVKNKRKKNSDSKVVECKQKPLDNDSMGESLPELKIKRVDHDSMSESLPELKIRRVDNDSMGESLPELKIRRVDDAQRKSNSRKHLEVSKNGDSTSRYAAVSDKQMRKRRRDDQTKADVPHNSSPLQSDTLNGEILHDDVSSNDIDSVSYNTEEDSETNSSCVKKNKAITENELLPADVFPQLSLSMYLHGLQENSDVSSAPLNSENELMSDQFSSDREKCERDEDGVKSILGRGNGDSLCKARTELQHSENYDSNRKGLKFEKSQKENCECYDSMSEDTDTNFDVSQASPTSSSRLHSRLSPSVSKNISDKSVNQIEDNISATLSNQPLEPAQSVKSGSNNSFLVNDKESNDDFFANQMNTLAETLENDIRELNGLRPSSINIPDKELLSLNSLKKIDTVGMPVSAVFSNTKVNNSKEDEERETSQAIRRTFLESETCMLNEMAREVSTPANFFNVSADANKNIEDFSRLREKSIKSTLNFSAEYESPQRHFTQKTNDTAVRLNRRNQNGDSSLHLACIQNMAYRVKEILSVPGVDVNLRDNNGWTPLHEACLHGSYECVELLLKHVPDLSTLEETEQSKSKVEIDAIGPEGITPLHDAVRNNHVDICKLLLKYGGQELLKTRQEGNYTALNLAETDEMRNALRAASHVDFHSINDTIPDSGSPQRQLTKKRKETAEKLNKRNYKGESALHVACIKKKSSRVKEILSVPGVDVNMRDNCGWTPLHEACLHGSYECVELLLGHVPPPSTTGAADQSKSKVEINAIGPEGITPLHDAVRNNHVDVCKLLLKYGGQELLMTKTELNNTAMDLAPSDEMRNALRAASHVDFHSINDAIPDLGLPQRQLTRKKKETAEKLNKRNCKGESALHVACIEKNSSRVKEILSVPGVDVNMRDNCGWTPLHKACLHGSYECVELLLGHVPPPSTTGAADQSKSKVEIYAIGPEGITPLHDAVRNNHIGISVLLLRHGGQQLLMTKTELNNTAMDLAQSEEMRNVLSALSTYFPQTTMQ